MLISKRVLVEADSEASKHNILKASGALELT